MKEVDATINVSVYQDLDRNVFVQLKQERDQIIVGWSDWEKLDTHVRDMLRRLVFMTPEPDVPNSAAPTN